MADNYLQFSETLDDLTEEQEAWLQQQVEPIVVSNGIEYPDGEDPTAADPSYQGLRFLRDYEDLDDDADTPGFYLEFHGPAAERYAWFYAEEHGDPDRVAHVLRKFLKQFRPRDCWGMTYACTCSKPRAGEFGGGAVFVTADEIQWQSAYEFVEKCKQAFQRRNETPAKPEGGVEEEYLSDASGRKLPRDNVEELAANNICDSGEGVPGAALDAYIESMNDESLLQWATDEKGNFPISKSGEEFVLPELNL